MNEYLNPEKINNQIIANKINIREGLKLFESILTKSDDEIERLKVIKYLSSISVERESIYKILESSLISDESAKIRCASAKILTKNYTEFDISPLLWAIERENSILFFEELLDVLENQNDSSSNIIREKLYNRLSVHYKLDNQDARFILDLDYLDYLKFEADLEDFLNDFKLTQHEIQEIVKENSQLGYKGLARIKKEEQGHIIALELKNIEEIPNSICKLPELKSLEIYSCNLKVVPMECRNLESIHKLILKNSEFSFLPNWVITFAKNEIREKCYIKEEVNSSEAYILVLLEMLSGHKCIKVSKSPTIESLVTVCYRLNEAGNISGIYYSNKNYPIRLIPKHLCQLKFLEELTLSNQKVKEIPICLANLELLKSIDLSKNLIIRIPNEFSVLKNIEIFNLNQNPLDNIPKSIRKISYFKF